jgi:2-polyprenyl-6-methoxyphenol hydroxylase-like FAD-dependent oxidoreductase
MASYDLAIVGGGIGGSAMAAVMARAGRSVLLLEQSEVYETGCAANGSRRGAWTRSKRRRALRPAVRVGGHHVTRHVTYDESRDPATPRRGRCRSTSSPRACRAAVPGPSAALPDPVRRRARGRRRRAARRAVTDVRLGERPGATFEHAGETIEAEARLVVGADGRTSQVREAAGVTLHQDKPHHWFAGLLVEGAQGWDEDLQAIGTEDDLGFLAFPQGGGRVRIYGGYALDEAKRFRGSDAARRFLDAFAMRCSPMNQHLVAGTPAGPLHSYINAEAGPTSPMRRASC